MIDLNAIAKGWGVDQLFEYIRIVGMKNFMVEIGGEVRTLGKNNKGKNWQIGIDRPMFGTMPGEIFILLYPSQTKPWRPRAITGILRNITMCGILILLIPGQDAPPNSNIASVTVVAPNCMDADALRLP